MKLSDEASGAWIALKKKKMSYIWPVIHVIDIVKHM